MQHAGLKVLKFICRVCTERNKGKNRLGTEHAEDHFGDEARGFVKAAQGPNGD